MVASKTLLVSWLAGLLTISVSEPEITVCLRQIDGIACQLICTTSDFLQTIIFRQNGVSRGFCLSGGSCNTGVTGYFGPYRIGTTQTVLNISAYDRTRDPGEWTCSLGASQSLPVAMHYAILPVSATIPPNNVTVNSITQISITTECAYINISGIIQFRDTIYRQKQICTEIPSSGCASGTGEKYNCTFTFEPKDMPAGSYLLEFRVNLPYDNTDPQVTLTSVVYITFPSFPATVPTTTESSDINECGTSCQIGAPLGGLAIVSLVAAVIVYFKRNDKCTQKTN